MKLTEVRKLLERLDLPRGDWALHGSGPLLAHGLVDEVNDVDIVARDLAWQKAVTLAPPEPGDKDDVVRPLPGVEIYDGWLGDDADELIRSAVSVAGIPCVSLTAVLRFKRRLGRAKDWHHIELLERYLREDAG